MKARLNAVKSLVPSGTRLLDVGSDHAELPTALIKEGIVPHAVATDINIHPLERARIQAERAGLSERFDFILSDGFENVPLECFDVAAICGMGGLLIKNIINNGGEKSKKPLILQPMTDADILRGYLWDNGFIIEKEMFVTEGVKPYLIMAVKYTGEKTEYTYTDLYLGKERPQTNEYEAYAGKQRRAAQKRLIGAKNRREPLDGIYALINGNL